MVNNGKIEASAISFSFLNNEGRIEIPFFQRSYVWEETNWERLLDDLLESYETQIPHFLGSLVLKQLPSQVGEKNKRSLIDGQQRLTTFSILVKALYDKLPTKKRSITSCLYDDDDKIKIIHSSFDRKSFNDVLHSEKCEYEYKENDNNKIRACYAYFNKKIDEKIKDKGKFLEFIVNAFFFVGISIDENVNEQQIFDSINSAGMLLTAADIIKNDLFAKLLKNNDEIKVKELYEEYWHKLFETKETDENGDILEDFWGQKTKKNKFHRIENFLYYFAISKGFFKEKDKRENLSKIYKEEIKENSNLEEFLKDIKFYAECYKNLEWCKDDDFFTYDNNEKKIMHIISKSNLESFMPLVLQLKICYKKGVLTEQELNRCFYELEKVAMNLWIGRKSTKPISSKVSYNLSKISDYNSFMNFINNNFKDIDKKEVEVSLQGEDLLHRLKRLENDKAKLILFWIELSKISNKDDNSSLQYNFELEHIMPQTLDEWIKDEDNPNPNLVANLEDTKKLVYQIGNMTLIRKNSNISNSNKKWSEKKENLKEHSSLKITSEIINYKNWSKKEIKDRTERLIQDFFKLWGI